MNDTELDYDLLIIGGGVNGAGIAADAAGRGLNVLLCEKSDIASATSSASSKLIHGGLRYLEYYEFSLVRKSLQEREILAAAAPHLIKPLAIHIPQLPHSRHPLLVRAGLFLYDNLARRRLFNRSRAIAIGPDSPLIPAITKGFEYWDGYTDDARLVLANALQARQHGATIATRTECVALEPADTGWRAVLRDATTSEQRSVRCRVVVNAAGPWVNNVLTQFSRKEAMRPLRLVKGSHIVVPKMYSGEHAYLLQNDDGRVIFVIPYLGNYTLIGTTEQDYNDDLDDVAISQSEISYLIDMVNRYFRATLLHSDVVHTYAGVRPLIDTDGESTRSATKVSRDYQLLVERSPQPVLTVYGGKITTYRKLAEDAMAGLREFFPDMKPAWTKQARLPGGDFDAEDNLFHELVKRCPGLGAELISRWCHSYGTLSFSILDDVTSVADMGRDFGYGLYEKEVDYLCRQEWAYTAEDILWRRTKLGYLFSASEVTALEQYLQQPKRREASQQS